MNIKRYMKRKSPLPILALVLPCIPVIVALIHTAFMLYAKSMGDIMTMLSIAIIMITSQAVACCAPFERFVSWVEKSASLGPLYGTDYGCCFLFR